MASLTVVSVNGERRGLPPPELQPSLSELQPQATTVACMESVTSARRDRRRSAVSAVTGDEDIRRGQTGDEDGRRGAATGERVTRQGEESDER